MRIHSAWYGYMLATSLLLVITVSCCGFRASRNWSFDEWLVHYGCEVHTFDPRSVPVLCMIQIINLRSDLQYQHKFLSSIMYVWSAIMPCQKSAAGDYR